jgi:hypothetical protein
MHFEFPFVEDDVVRAESVPVTPRLVANARFEGVRAALNYWVFHVKPVMQGLLHTKPRERAVLGLFYRAMGYVASIRRLNHPMHVQAIAASARSLFELGLDMALFSLDQTDDSLRRIAAFTRVERYRVARKLVDFYAGRPGPPDLSLSQQQATVADAVETAAVEALVQQYWGRNRKGELNWPKHWSAFPETRGRAKHVGGPWEERYVRQYYMFSWHIHPGLVGVAGLPKEAFEVFASQAYGLSADVILDCYRIVGVELKLDSAIPNWIEHLRFLGHITGMALVDARLQALGEPARLLYLEAQEREPDGLQ